MSAGQTASFSLEAPIQSPSRVSERAPSPTPSVDHNHTDMLVPIDDESDGSEYTPIVRQPSSPSRATGGGKGKGKERASDVGIRARSSSKKVWTDRSVSPVEGKRDRRPSKRLLDAIGKEKLDQDDGQDRKSTRLNSSHSGESRMPSSA